MVDGGNKQVLFLFYLGAFLKLSTIVRLPKMCNPPLGKKQKQKKNGRKKLMNVPTVWHFYPKLRSIHLKLQE